MPSRLLPFPVVPASTDPGPLAPAVRAVQTTFFCLRLTVHIVIPLSLAFCLFVCLPSSLQNEEGLWSRLFVSHGLDFAGVLACVLAAVCVGGESLLFFSGDLVGAMICDTHLAMLAVSIAKVKRLHSVAGKVIFVQGVGFKREEAGEAARRRERDSRRGESTSSVSGVLSEGTSIRLELS